MAGPVHFYFLDRSGPGGPFANTSKFHEFWTKSANVGSTFEQNRKPNNLKAHACERRRNLTVQSISNFYLSLIEYKS